MKHTYRIHGLSNSGKPGIYFACEHCRRWHMHLTATLYSARPEHDPRIDIEAAASEFVRRLDNGDASLVASPRTWAKLDASLCHCDPDVLDLEHERAVRRARAIRDAGIRALASRR